MERRIIMREEKVTINILNWLEANDWEIVCFDFPQSGTGILLHLNDDKRSEKNKGGIIPDIIAVKNKTALFFENKDRFYEPDFEKLLQIKSENNYSDSLDKLLIEYKVKDIVYGIGIPTIKKHISKSLNQIDKIDFLISTNAEKEVEVHYDVKNVF